MRLKQLCRINKKYLVKSGQHFTIEFRKKNNQYLLENCFLKTIQKLRELRKVFRVFR